MSKHKPATASKHARKPKVIAKAQRAKQAIVRSPKSSSFRSVTESSAESPSERHPDSPPEASRVQNPATAARAIQTVGARNSSIGLDFASATANVRAFQAKLLEISQVNMQFAFEFAQRFAAIRSPVEFFKVSEELTSKRITMFRKHSKEIAELGIQGRRV
jgi:hypothetical protein